MSVAAALRRALEELDVDAMLRIHADALPHLPPPADRQQVLAGLHHARTQAESIHRDKRFYSHRWLIDRGYPTGLPDHMKPSAERMYPRTVHAVGISVRGLSDITRPIAGEVRTAMEHAVLEAEADGKLLDRDHVAARMGEAKTKAIRTLIGR